MEKILAILKSKQQHWILTVAAITGIALSIALPTGHIKTVEMVFKFFVNIT
nr:hypothetical protein [Acinetobacter baumannii]